MAPRMTKTCAQMELRNVHYVYPSRPSAPALSGVSLMLDPGRLVALVSPHGSTHSLYLRPAAGLSACRSSFQQCCMGSIRL